MPAESSRGVSTLTRVEAVLRNPETYALANAVPRPPKHHGGRPRAYPDFMVFVYEALISVYGSARQVEAELAHRIVWRLVQRQVAKRTGLRLRGEPMRRHHYLYLRTRYLTALEVQQTLGDIHRQHAAFAAGRVGLLDPDGPGSWTHPHPTRVLYGDGKVITPLYRAHPGDVRLDKSTGELIPKRCEPDGGLHFEGTGETAWGTKFVLVAARGAGARQRIILDTCFVDRPGAEASTSTEVFARVARTCPAPKPSSTTPPSEGCTTRPSCATSA